MLSWPAMKDEKRMRLRASCNACNESKVRCSQRKPTCTRCERNETECIYGLSRRTHKDAPPISIPPSQRQGRPSRLGRSPQIGRPPRLPSSVDTCTSTSTNSNSTSKATIFSNDYVTPDESVETHNNANLLSNYMFLTATEPDPMHGTAQLLNFSGEVTGSTSSTSSTAMAPGYFSTAEAEYTSLEPLFNATHNNDAIDMETCRTLNSEDKCTCHSGVIELLASMRGGSNNSNDQRLTLDAQLAKLKHCITLSETSIGCTHSREDSEPIHIMAVAMLIGYVIDDFEMVAQESSLCRSSSLSSWVEMATLGNTGRGSKSSSGRGASPSSTNMSLGGLMEPRLSWGMLELEDDDEMDLRQRLYLLSFRKLERLLSQLTLYLRDLHNVWASLPDPSRHMAFVIACDYTRLWLEKKASGVKRLFTVPTKDERMDSATAYSDINAWCE